MKSDMLIITGQYFNKFGNQSFLEAIRHYEQYFNITIITSARIGDAYYYSTEDINQILPSIKTIAIRSNRLTTVQSTIHKIMAKLSKLAKWKMNKNPEPKYIKNGNYTLFDYIGYLYISKLLYHNAVKYVKREQCKPEYICSYEIIGIKPTIQLQKKHLPQSITFGKFQGSVLGNVLENINDRRIRTDFRIDIASMKNVSKLNRCIMTNDGTYGKDVLKYFGVHEKDILFLPNGIPSAILAKKAHIKGFKNEFQIPIKLFSVSRLIFWKRIPLVVKIMNELVNNLEDKRFIYKIYGSGDAQEISEVADLIVKSNLQNYVFYKGSVPFEQLDEVYAHNDILMSLYLFSNVCNPVLEATYYGIPIISIYDQNIIEIVDSKNASNILFIEENEQQLIKDIAKKLHDMDERTLHQLYAEAEHRRHTTFSWQERALKEIQFLSTESN